jgi:hypothetical protein
MQKKQKWSPYTELGVPRDATEAQVKTAYKKMALKWHPDKHPESEREHATEQFKKVSEAYSILSNEKRRKYFDKHGTMEGEDDAINMDDLFAEMFAGMGGGASFGFTFDFEDMFEDFADGLKGSKESKAFSKMFKDLEKSAKRASKPKGRAGRATANKKAKGKGLGGVKDMDDMMMAMVMGDMMGDLMGFGGMPGAGKGKAKGTKSSAKAKDPFGGMAAAFAGMMEADDSYEDELPDDLFEGDEYDSDEVEMIGKQMGLAKSEIKILKRDMKKKYEQANAHKKQPPKKAEPE